VETARPCALCRAGQELPASALRRTGRPACRRSIPLVSISALSAMVSATVSIAIGLAVAWMKRTHNPGYSRPDPPVPSRGPCRRDCRMDPARRTPPLRPPGLVAVAVPGFRAASSGLVCTSAGKVGWPPSCSKTASPWRYKTAHARYSCRTAGGFPGAGSAAPLLGFVQHQVKGASRFRRNSAARKSVRNRVRAQRASSATGRAE
jgi:hypothetical protein